MAYGGFLKQRRRRPLRDGEKRYELNGRSHFIYRRKGADWQTYCQLRLSAAADERAIEWMDAEELLPEIDDAIKATPISGQKGWPTHKMLLMYLVNTFLGWDYARIARALECHRTLPSKYIRVVEDARDDDAFDTLLTKLERDLEEGAADV